MRVISLSLVLPVLPYFEVGSVRLGSMGKALEYSRQVKLLAAENQSNKSELPHTPSVESRA